jgi:GT2 family glycosyltransferase/predicted O-methyltransferase YrrM
MKTSIVIPTMTYTFTQKCVDSIIAHTSLDDLEIIIVANGAGTELWDYANDLSGKGYPVSILWYPEPMGPVPALNAGIREAKGDFILLLNDDCAILPSPKDKWLNDLHEPFSDPKMMVTGPSMIRTHIMGHNELLFLSKEDIEYGFIIFFMALIRRQAFDEAGLLDETLLCGVDLDFCLKMRRKGYLIQQVPKDDQLWHNGGNLLIGTFPMWHQGEGTVHHHYGVDQWTKILKADAETLKVRYGKSVRPRASIVIPTYGNSLDTLKECVNHAVKNTNLSDDVELIIVANGCPESVRAYVGSLNVTLKRLVWFDNPIGFCSAVNAGVSVASGAVIVLLNHDAYVLHDTWLDILLEPFSSPTVGITGPVVGECSLVNRSFVMFFCAAIRREVFDQIGLLDTIYNPGGLDDVDFTIRAENAGWESVRVPTDERIQHTSRGFSGTFPIYHMEHHDDWMSSDILQRNSKILTDRYNKIDRPIIEVDWNLWQKKYELLMIQEYLRHERVERILEIGTAHGGSTLLWAKMVEHSKGHVYTIDLPHGATMIDGTHYRPMVTEFRGDSHDPTMVSHIKEEIGIGKIDVLFIDGDHSYEGVKQDFENFYDLVRPDGFIIFHDILDSDVHRKVGCYVSKLWSEIKDKHESHEFIDPNKYGHNVPANSMGVGVIRKGTAPGKKAVASEDIKVEVPLKKDGKDVLCSICTKNRYDSTLPLALQSVSMQTVKPAALMIYDDNTEADRIDIRENETYRYLLEMFDRAGIKWSVVFGAKLGQHYGHQEANKREFRFVWRLDDDEVAEPAVLEKYLNLMTDDVGAVGGTVLTKGIGGNNGASPRLERIYNSPNVQWTEGSKIIDVDHLHSTFLYRAGIVNYNLELSPVAHREETIFSHELKRKGYRLLVDQSAITHHLKQSSTGIRSHQSEWFYKHDERVFSRYMESWGYKLLNLDCGIGDHYAFLNILPELKKKYAHLIIGACFPEIFKDHPDVTLIHIAQSAPVNPENIYKWMQDCKWTGMLVDAYATFYGVES